MRLLVGTLKNMVWKVPFIQNPLSMPLQILGYWKHFLKIYYILTKVTEQFPWY